MVSPLLLVVTLGLAFALHRIIGALRILHSVDYLGGHRTLISLPSILYFLLPDIPGIKLSRLHVFKESWKVFENVGWDAYLHITFWPKLAHTILVADVEAIKDFTRRFPKPLEIYESTNIYGRHIVSTDGDLWKKYRRISSPAFSEKNNRLVWGETLRIVDDLMENVWNNQDAVVGHGKDITLQLALFVIGAAGFGQKVSWGEDRSSIKAGGHQLTFQEALHVITGNLVLNIALPWWIKVLPHPRLKRIRQATNELGDYMREMIRDRESVDTQDKHDLFSSLIQANKGETGMNELMDQELIGNIFIFLVAGHETTAHTLAFTFALLALYPDIQEKLFNHIKQTIPDGRRPSYEDIPNLTYVMACVKKGRLADLADNFQLSVYLETLRLFPPVFTVTKVAPESTWITVGNSSNNETRRIPIPKGSYVAAHVPAVQKSPRYWEKPDEFIPERFLGNYNKDAILAFSLGLRACLGRKFNETEGVAAITSLISHYKIEIQDEPRFKNETFEERKSRILEPQLVLTLAPKRLPLKFKRR